MTTSDFKNELKKGSAICGAYLFYGEEDYMKRFYLAELKKLLIQDKSLETFNYVRFCGNDETSAGLRRTLMSLPVFAEKKLIVIEELDGKALSASMLAEISDCIAMIKEYDYNVLVIYTRPELFDVGTEKSPSKIMKALCGSNAKGGTKDKRKAVSSQKADTSVDSMYAVPVEFPYETPAKLAKWVEKHFAAENISVVPEVCQKLVTHAGRDMNTLAREIEKLCAYAKSHFPDNAVIAPEDIEKIVPQNREINAFDFANSIISGEMDTAFYILSDMKLRRERPEIILSSVSKVYTDLYVIKLLYDSGKTARDISEQLKIHEYRVSLYIKNSARLNLNLLEKAVELCAEADLKIKSTSLDSYVVLEELVIAVRAALSGRFYSKKS